MAQKAIRNTETGEVLGYDSVDAREILSHNKEGLYELVDIHVEGAPVPRQNVEDEFRRRPVGDDNPEIVPDKVQTTVSNSISDQPRMVMPAGDNRTVITPAGEGKGKAEDDLDTKTVAELEGVAGDESVDLTGLKLKADIITAIRAKRKG